MPTKLVKIGDIIRIDKGMHIITQVPANVFNKEMPFSEGFIDDVVEVGKIYQSSPYSRDKILELINEFLNLKLNVSASNKDLNDFVDKLPIDYEVKSFDTSFLEGEYVVIDACFLNMLIAPYRVSCYKKDNPKIKMMFYQRSPKFKANISTEIEIIGNLNEK